MAARSLSVASRALVPDAAFGPAVRRDADREPDRRFRRGKLDGVGDQVVDHLVEGGVVAQDERKVRGVVLMQRQGLAAARLPFGAGRRRRRAVRETGVRVIVRPRSAAEFREKLLDEGEHLVGSVQDVRRDFQQALVVELPGAVMQELRAHLHPAEMVFQVVGEDAEKLVLVLGQPAQPVARLLQRQVGPHPRDELRLVEGLGDIVDPAGLERLDDHRLVVGRRDEDDRDLAQLRPGADAPADLESVDLGHQQVEQDQVGRPDGQTLERFLPAGHRDNLKAKHPQHVAEHLDVRLLVVHDEDASGWRAAWNS